jgi:hypothetical protein
MSVRLNARIPRSICVNSVDVRVVISQRMRPRSASWVGTLYTLCRRIRDLCHHISPLSTANHSATNIIRQQGQAATLYPSLQLTAELTVAGAIATSRSSFTDNAVVGFYRHAILVSIQGKDTDTCLSQHTEQANDNDDKGARKRRV